MIVQRILLPTAVIAILVALSLTPAGANAPSDAKDFVKKASTANKFEIDSSKLALEKSSNAEVKHFAQEMIDDHTSAGDKLKTTADAEGLSAAVATTLDAKHQAILAKLQAAKGDAFDKQYIDAQTKAHEEAVTLFGNYAKNGKDEAIKNFAAETLPTLKEHREHVKEVEPAPKS